MGFSIAQPFLVGRVVTVLQQSDSLSLDIGYGLIGATLIVFIGIAVSHISPASLVPVFTPLAHDALIIFSRCPDPLTSIWDIYGGLLLSFCTKVGNTSWCNFENMPTAWI